MKFSVTCETCGVGFTTTRASTQRPPRFCSQKCNGASRVGQPVPPRATRSFTDRLAEKFRAASGGCWEWTGGRSAAGYGMIRDEGQVVVYAHRALYQLLVGPIPEGLELDHLCRNRACVNPAHVEPVTHEENMRRAAPHRKAV